MPIKPMFTVSGYRGIWGESLNEEIVFNYALAFAKYIKKNNGKKILIGRDARKTGTKILNIIKNAFNLENIEVEYAGIIPTPSILLLVRKLNFDGGIIITASHNPKEYNGLKFVRKGGLFIEEEIIQEIEGNKKEIEENQYFENIKIQKLEIEEKKYRGLHTEEILKNIDTAGIKEKKYKVAFDPINSAGSIIIRELLESLSCEVFGINEEQNGEFTHEPEPLIKNLTQIKEYTALVKADIGFALDPDADRLVVVDDKGEILSEEYTLALSIFSVFLKGEKSDAVINMSTSKMNDEVAKMFGQKIIKTKVGELNVVKKIIEIDAKIGGEGNGGVIYPKINTARDSLVGIGLILELMSRTNKKISEIVADIPKYTMQKDKIPFTDNLENIYKKLETYYTETEINNLDGLRFDFKDGTWLHIRPSNTEPIIRIYGESKNEENLKQKIEETKKIILN